jgi:competence protein ComEA
MLFLQRKTFGLRRYLPMLMLAGVLAAGVSLSALAEDLALPPAQVNINTADAETLAMVLDGVGQARAEAIVAWREANGSFGQVEDLAQVRGIGVRTLEVNADRIKVAD